MTLTNFKHRQERILSDGSLLIIRPAIPEDKQNIIENINAVCDEQIYLASNQYVPTPAWEAALDNINGEQNLSMLVVAEVNERVIGHGRAFPAGFGVKDAHVVELGIALLKDYRLQNIGAILLEYLMNWSKQAGYTKIVASVFSNNKVALHVFDKLGFIIEGALVAQYKLETVFVDEIKLAKFV